MQRSVRQQLESLARAGLTHLPRGRVEDYPSPQLQPVSTAPVNVKNPASTNLGNEAVPTIPRAVGAHSSSTESAASTSIPAPTSLLMPVAATPIAASADESLPPRERLAVLNEQVRQCQRCPELASSRRNTVFGVGDPQAKILFLGEAPGADEDQKGEPFVGAAGQLLNQIIVASRLKREELYICNILKCRPPNNRTPNETECANCREYLLGQLEAVDPDYIVCWGSVAAHNLLATKLSVGKLRGRFQSYGRAKVLCTYHPAYLLRNPEAKKDVWQDMKMLMAEIGVDLNVKS